MSIPANITENGLAAAANGIDLGQQLEHLKRRVAALEQDLAAANAKCAQYREFVLQWLSSQHTSEELRKFALDDDESRCQPLSQFVGELEALVSAGKRGA